MSLKTIHNKIHHNERLDEKDGQFMLSADCDLLALGQLAHQVRLKKNPSRQVTFVIDSNPNYTNVCETKCLFCAFHRAPHHPEAYCLTIPQVMRRIRTAVRQGATTILLQGGHNRHIGFSYYVDLIKTTRKKFPHVTPHFFSAPEIQYMSKISHQSVRQVLQALKNAGQTTLPGGGAEILSDRVRKKISPEKGISRDWLQVHKTAHELGLKSTATMMYGHIETSKDIVKHWEYIRRLQDKTKGFTAFVPWSFKRAHSCAPLQAVPHASPTLYLRLLAASRLYLDNFAHIQCSWFSEGKKTGQVALHFGADDFGGLLINEEVHAAAGFRNKCSLEEMTHLIRSAGFVPAQRNTLYETLKTKSKF